LSDEISTGKTFVAIVTISGECYVSFITVDAGKYLGTIKNNQLV